MIAGTAGLLAGPESLLGGTVTEMIQRSIIAERILGLPCERDISVGIRFRDVRTR